MSSRALVSSLILLISTLCMAGCGESLDPHTPDGALRSFAQSLVRGSTAELFGHLSQSTKQSLSDLATLSKKLNERVEGLPLKTQAWARAKAMPSWMAERMDMTPEQILELMMGDMLKGVRAAPSDEVMQAFNARRVVYEDQEQGVVGLKTREFAQIKMRKEGDVWRFATLEDALSDATKTALANIAMIEKNKKEIKRRERLQLPLPKL